MVKKKIEKKAKWDSSLSDSENLDRLEEEIKELSDKKVTTGDISNLEQEDEELPQDYLKKIKKAENEAIEALKLDKKELDCYSNLRNYVRMVLDKEHNSNLLIIGSSGIGKTYVVVSELAKLGLKLGIDYELISSTVTVLELYHLLYKNNGKLIILDDVDLFSNRKMVNILKAALWSTTAIRNIQYHTTSDKLRVPAEFICKSQFIIIINDIPQKNNKDVQALLSRALFYKLEFSYTEIIMLLSEIAKKPYKKLEEKERMEVMNYIKEISSEATTELNIRTMVKSFEIYIYGKKHKEADWKEMIKALIDTDETLLVVKFALEHFTSTWERVKYFRDKTGMSRRTYFNLRKKILERNPTLK